MKVFRKVRAREYKVLFVSPERFLSYSFMALMDVTEVSVAVVDEVRPLQCIRVTRWMGGRCIACLSGLITSDRPISNLAICSGAAPRFTGGG